MQEAKSHKIKDEKSHFGFVSIAGFFFIIIGVLMFLSISGVNLPVDIKNLQIMLQYGVSAGSILGGAFMIFRKK